MTNGSWQAQNEALETRNRILRMAYDLSLSEFSLAVLPALLKFPFVPKREMQLPEIVERFWLASTPVTSATDWKVRNAAHDARDQLCGFFHPSVLETCLTLRRNFEYLQQAKAAGYRDVTLVSRARCSCFGSHHDSFLNIDEALLGFEDVKGGWILILSQCGCAQTEDPRLCDVSMLVVQPPEPADCPDFTAWLNEVLKVQKS